ARLNISTTAWQVRGGVRAALVNYSVAARRTALLRDHAELQQRAFELLEQRRVAGAVSAAEVVPLRIGLTKQRDDLADAQRQTADARARLADSLGLSVRALEGFEFTFDLNLPSDAALLAADARQRALLGRADILAALSEYAASQSALQLEIAKQYPDLHFNPGY